MASTLNREAYENLIAEDIAVLKGALPQWSLERQHIEAVLLHSITANYNNQGQRIRELEAKVASQITVGAAAGQVMQDYLNRLAEARTLIVEAASSAMGRPEDWLDRARVWNAREAEAKAGYSPAERSGVRA